MIAVGEVGVSKRYGGGRDGIHHQMGKRMVYKKAPEPEKKQLRLILSLKNRRVLKSRNLPCLDLES